MRELIRLLSSRLPAGKIPGIWEFVLPLLYNSLALSLADSLLLQHSMPKNPSAIANQSLHSPCPLCDANHHLPCVFLCSTANLFSSPIQMHPPSSPFVLYFIEAHQAASTCNHVIRPFLQSPLLLSSHLVPRLLIVCFSKAPKWLLVTTDCMTDTALPLWSSLHLPSTCNFTLLPWRSCPLVHACLCHHRFSAGQTDFNDLHLHCARILKRTEEYKGGGGQVCEDTFHSIFVNFEPQKNKFLLMKNTDCRETHGHSTYLCYCLVQGICVTFLSIDELYLFFLFLVTLIIFSCLVELSHILPASDLFISGLGCPSTCSIALIFVGFPSLAN